MKTCFKCNNEKPMSEFYKHAQMKDGHLNKCISCTKKDAREHRDLNIDKIRKYDRDRGNRQHKEYMKEYRDKYPKKYKAHIKLNNEKKKGNIKQLPCEVCGEENSVAHHDDYNYPLSVRWLCSAHHHQWHAKNGEAKNAS